MRARVEDATPENVAPFGWLLGSSVPDPGTRLNFYDGVLRKPTRFESDEQTELTVATLRRRPFAVRWLERHFKHTQTFIPLRGKPFVVVLAPPNDRDMPDIDQIRALRFDGSAGFCMRIGCWHEFPFVIEDDTDLIVILRRETHANLRNISGTEAEGADLEKRDLQLRLDLSIELDLA
jgi:ureidoglycolate lyase